MSACIVATAVGLQSAIARTAARKTSNIAGGIRAEVAGISWIALGMTGLQARLVRAETAP